MSILREIKQNILNIPGWKTRKRIIVIESDDWGTIRTSSRDSFNYLVKKGLPVRDCPYNSNDSLESNKDLEMLLDVLATVKTQSGTNAVFTANNIVANPDFEKIKDSGYKDYFFEPFTDTLNRYPNHDKVEKLYTEGISHKLFYPQFHGREHVNVKRWLEALQHNKYYSLLAFNHNMFSVHAEKYPVYKNEFMDAFDADSHEHLLSQTSIINEGLDLFEKIWGYKSESFIAPCYIWSPTLEVTLKSQGIKFIQGITKQLMPLYKQKFKYKSAYHYIGQLNQNGQRYIIRNAFFEPSILPRYDWESNCLRRIEIAFKWNKPAIIGSHRLNYIGSIHPENQESNLKRLKFLLKAIVNKWPDVEFLTSNHLGNLMMKNHND